MKSFESTFLFPKPDKVDHAVAGVRSAIEKLAQLMCQADDDVLVKAASSLGRMGIFAARPVAAVISGDPNPMHRIAMLMLLRTIVPALDLEIGFLLAGIAVNDPDERVRAMAADLFGDMRNDVRQHWPGGEPPDSQPRRDAFHLNS